MVREVRKSNPWRWASLQLLVLSFCVITMGMYIASIPRYYNALVTTCIVQGCGNSVPAMWIPDPGLTLENYALLFVLIDCVFTFVFYATSAVLLWKGFREPMGLLAAAAMVAFGTSFPSLAMVATEGSVFAQNGFMLVSMLGWISMSLFFFLFPDGCFVPRWTRWVFLLIVAVDVLQLVYRGQMWDALDVPEYITLVWYVGSTMILIYSQVYRFRKVSQPVQRQQTKWVVYGVSIGFVGFVGMSILFDPGLNNGSALTYVILNAVLNLSLTAIPITLMMAILRKRLWNIDPLVNRTLVYAALSVCVVLLYTFAVLYLGQLFRTKDHFIVSLLATAVVAVAFAPLKEWLQRQINRLMKGRHDDPYAVLLELGNQLIQPLAPEAMLDAVVRTVREALRLPYTGISIGVSGEEKMVASAGESVNELHAFPVIHRGEELGTLYIASRSPGEAFSPEDYKFLDVLLRQAGPIVENVNMTLGMKLLAKDLQESREKLVLAREEERRQIRKNLHDDLAPRLAALALNAATAQRYVEKEPSTAIEMLTDLRQVIRSTVHEIRTMVHDLRPPTLDELGLIGAIQERIHELSKPAQLLAQEQGTEPLRIGLQAPTPLPPLPAAVEVAAYRIVIESVVNVIKHARATSCTVRLDVHASHQMTVEITDNGISCSIRSAAAAAGKGGIGQQSIRERAAELGGQCTIESLEQGGTRVFAVLPL
ncbi:histidine kinase [Paenibacillus sp. HJGM_3]|uniref:GAF domain-containing sensor histidine kinase n=1 Tax=Paenibacillus sp. HJGM_3 TaxID=3379816 RepID=UPI00385F5417